MHRAADKAGRICSPLQCTARTAERWWRFFKEWAGGRGRSVGACFSTGPRIAANPKPPPPPPSSQVQDEKWTLRTQQPEDSSKVTRSAMEFCAVPTARLSPFLYFKCGIVPFLTPPRTEWRRCFSMRGYPPTSTHSQTFLLSPATPKGKTGYLLKNQKYPERQFVVPQVRWV